MKKFFDPYELAPSINDNLSNLEYVAMEYEKITNNPVVFNISDFRGEKLHLIQNCAYGFRLAAGGAIGDEKFKPPLNFNSSTNDEYTTSPPLAANRC